MLFVAFFTSPRLEWAALAAVLISSTTDLHAFNTDTHAPLSHMAARHYQSQVEDYLRTQLLEPRGLSTIGYVHTDVYFPRPQRPEALYTFTLLRALELGAIDEDSEQGAGRDISDSVPDTFERRRMGNHFYCPTHVKRGFDDEAFNLAFRNAASAYSWFTDETIPTVDSLLWAWDNREARDSIRGDEHYGWVQARAHYFNWLTNSNMPERAWSAGETFYALGHVIHLVQDLAQPQHTRNDGHSQPQWYGKIPVGDDALFEKYCSANFGTLAQVKGLPGPPPIPVFDDEDLPKNPPDGIPAEFMAFWDTGKLNGQKDQDPKNLPDVESLGLAEFSNSFFVTADTLFTGDYPVKYHGKYLWERQIEHVDPRHQFRFPRLEDIIGLDEVWPPPLGINFIARYGEGIPSSGWRSEYLARRKPFIPSFCSADNGLSGRELRLGISEVNLASHARALLPKAIAYSAGLLNYFFRGRLKMEFIYPEEVTAGDLQIGIVNLTEKEELRGGTFKLLFEDPRTTNRIELVTASESINQSYPGKLASGDGFTVSVGKSLPRDGKLILVFRGTIGNEKDIGVAAVAMPVACDNYVLLANGGTNTVVQWGDRISFTRYLITTNGNQVPKPLQTNGLSWWGSANVGDERSPFMTAPYGENYLVALRRGKWRLEPNDGGCVDVEVKGDGVVVHRPSEGQFDAEQNVKRSYICQIGETMVGSFTASRSGDMSGVNELCRYIFPNNAWGLAIRIPAGLRPGDKLVLQNTSVGIFARDVPSTDPQVRFFGGINHVINPYLFTREPWEIPLNVPRVPGDEDEPPAPPPPGLP